MKLYTNPVSPHCRKVHGVAAHVGTALDRKTVDLRAGARRSLDFLDLNPMGKVPVLVDGGVILWESAAIAVYIADKAGSDLWPDGERRYDVLRWLAWEGAHWTRPIGAILGQVVFNADNPDGAIVDKGRDDFRVLAGVLDGRLATRDFLTGRAPTVADYAVGVWLGYADLCGLPLAEFAWLSAWGARLGGLPGWPETAPPQ